MTESEIERKIVVIKDIIGECEVQDRFSVMDPSSHAWAIMERLDRIRIRNYPHERSSMTKADLEKKIEAMQKEMAEFKALGTPDAIRKVLQNNQDVVEQFRARALKAESKLDLLAMILNK